MFGTKIKLRQAKGGGGDTTTAESIPEWARPYIENVGKAAEQAKNEGTLANVAGTNPLLDAAFGSGANAIADTTNEGLINTSNQQGVIDAAQAKLYGNFDTLSNQQKIIGEQQTKLTGQYGVADANTQRLIDSAGHVSSGVSILDKQQGVLGDQQSRLTSHANSGGYDTSALKDKAILEAGVRTAALSNQHGQAGTLGSARQAVRQGAQNAATAAEFATIDQAAAQQNFANKMAAEQGLAGTVNTARGLSSGYNEATGAIGNIAGGINNTINTTGNIAQGITGASTAIGNLGQNVGSTATGLTNMATASSGLDQNKQSMATSAAQGFSKLGDQARGIEQESGDSVWQQLQRYASTIYGNPARQSTVAGGGGK